jgi:hypothetical protein
MRMDSGASKGVGGTILCVCMYFLGERKKVAPRELYLKKRDLVYDCSRK